MKIKCDFCKTEYTLDKIPASPVKCAICGHTWMVKTPNRRNQFITFMAALCALLSVVIFAIVVVTHYRKNSVNQTPLVASIVKTTLAPDANGVNHFIVSGILENRTDAIYGAPNLILVTYDGNGKQINSGEQFNPPATLLDAGARVPFVYTMRAPSAGVKKIVVKLGNFEK
ncbi:MAG: hypothetical protein J5608_03025 [Alphaproteobacteria bacterium]|nr:hypothetical protein [Alphaproteobacteria bacterium]